MKLLDGKVVLTSSEDQLEGTDLGLEESLDRGEIVDDLAGDGGRCNSVLDDRRGHSFPSGTRLEVQISRSIKVVKDFFLQAGNLVLHDSREFDILGGIHLVQDWADIISSDLGVIILSNILDKLHDFNREAIGLNPHSKLILLSFDLFDQRQEHRVHLVTEVVEVW